MLSLTLAVTTIILQLIMGVLNIMSSGLTTTVNILNIIQNENHLLIQCGDLESFNAEVRVKAKKFITIAGVFALLVGSLDILRQSISPIL